MQLLPADFRYCLAELQPWIGYYGWMWTVLRARRRRTGTFSNDAHSALRRFGNPRRPYFVGTTRFGVRFVGDYRDARCAAAASGTDEGCLETRFVESRLARARGQILDIGCGPGIGAAELARFMVGSDDLLAFEPDWTWARLAAATFALNDLNNIRLFPLAIDDRDGEVVRGKLDHAPRAPYESPAADQRSVLIRSVDSLFEQGVISRPALIHLHKGVDAEKALEGARSVIASFTPILILPPQPSNEARSNAPFAEIRHLIESCAPYTYRVMRNRCAPVPIDFVRFDDLSAGNANVRLCCDSAVAG